MSDQIDKIARACHEVNRIYCESIDDHSQPVWEEAPEWQRASARSGVIFLLTHPNAGPEASHENWLTDKERDGWCFGSVKDPVAKTHPCFVPYMMLPRQQRRKDEIFHAIVRSMA